MQSNTKKGFDNFIINKRECWLYTPFENINTIKQKDIICLPESAEYEELIINIIGKTNIAKERPFVLAGFVCPNWNKELTPWEAPGLVFKKSNQQEAFGGKGPETLDWLTNAFVPEIKTICKARQGDHIYLLGYSLAGLFSLWSLYNTHIFDGCGCCSGSLWYDGWLDYVHSHELQKQENHIYLSLGRGEGKTKNQRMAPIEENTKKTYELYQKDNKVKALALSWHEGGHFNNITGRMAMALEWLLAH